MYGRVCPRKSRVSKRKLVSRRTNGGKETNKPSTVQIQIRERSSFVTAAGDVLRYPAGSRCEGKNNQGWERQKLTVVLDGKEWAVIV